MASQFRAISLLGVSQSVKLRKSKQLNEDTIRGHYATQVLIALINSGFMDELEFGEAVSVSSFAAREDLDAVVLQALCDYAYELEYLNQNGIGYTLSDKGRLVDQVLKGALLSVYAYADVFANLEPLLRRQKVYGVDVQRRSKYVAVGSGLSAKLLAIPAVSKLLLDAKRTRILDLACGDAAFLINMCTSEARFTGYGVDIAPEAIAEGNEELARHGLTSRVQLLVADMFAMDTSFQDVADIDATTCIYALHEFLSDDNQRLLELLRKYRSRFPGVPLYVCEVIRHSPEELRRNPGGVMEIQLLHMLSNQRLATQAEWHDIFRRAGFGTIEEIYLDFARTAVFVAA